MSTLRPAAMEQILDELGDSRFGQVAFDTTFPDQGEVLASIIFTVRKGMRFAIHASNSATHPLVARMSPGQYKNEDIVRCERFQECVSLIDPWLKRIHEDLRIRDHNVDELLTFRQSIDAHIKDSVKDEGALFTEDERSDLLDKLKTLEDRIQDMEDKHVLTEKEVRHLRQVVEDAREDLAAMPKGIWYRTAGGKVWEVMKKAASTTEAKQLLAEAARKLIGL